LFSACSKPHSKSHFLLMVCFSLVIINFFKASHRSQVWICTLLKHLLFWSIFIALWNKTDETLRKSVNFTQNFSLVSCATRSDANKTFIENKITVIKNPSHH
jgi:multisubunit Na+/H+ antiporter MnhE subunit